VDELQEIALSLPLDVEAIPGWLHPMASLFTLTLMEDQADHAGRGDVFEIGVFRGKYLSILYHGCARWGGQVYGLDAFVGSDDPESSKLLVVDSIERVCGASDRLHIAIGNSLDLDPKSVIEVASPALSFASIDGGHERDVVVHDMALVLPLMEARGIVAMDDVFNHTTPGVTEAFFDFFLHSTSPTLVPFAHCYNKLFLSSPQHHGHYLAVAKAHLEQHQALAPCRRTLQRMSENASAGFVPRLLGYEIVPFL